MSSLRNSIQRRNHRERAQPQERSKWGLLEKRKDYKLRAADHKTKKRKIKALQQKASERNEDEFYFGMMGAQSKGGIKVAKRGEENSGGAKVLSADVVRLMKTQDVGYLRTMLQQTRKEREKVREDVVRGNVGVEIDVPAGDGRIVFGEDGENIPTPTPATVGDGDNLDDWLSEDAESDGGPKKDGNLTPEEQRKRHKQEVRRKKLEALKDRERDLSTALREVEDQRARMNGRVGGVNKQGVKFKARQRQR